MAAARSTADPWPLCPACADFPPRHDECDPVPFCMCLVEVMIEAEERERDGDTR